MYIYKFIIGEFYQKIWIQYNVEVVREMYRIVQCEYNIGLILEIIVFFFVNINICYLCNQRFFGYERVNVYIV